MSKKFNHLNIPSHWQSYWTRFPEGHTILEALIQWVSQVDEMVDSYNQLTNHVDNFKAGVNNTTSEFRAELNTFLDQFGDNLANEVITTLSEWQQSGFLDIVIDQAIETKFHEMDDRLTSQLAQDMGYNRWFQTLEGRLHFAHRGASRLAPENTIPAFELAGKMGFRGFECDLAITSDDEFVLMHDRTVDRTTDGTGNVSSLTLAQIKALTIVGGHNVSDYPNTKVPTLREFLSVCQKYNAIPVIEIKSDFTLTQCQKLVDMLDEFGMTESCVIIAYWAYPNAFNNLKSINPKMVFGVWVKDLSQAEVDRAKSYKNAFLFAEKILLTSETIKALKRQGLKVGIWTIFQTDYYNYPVKEIDFVMTDNLLEGAIQ